MDKYEMAKKIMACFPQSFVNYRGEFIAHAKSNTYLVLDNCETLEDLQCKVLEWFSRAAHKTAPFRSRIANIEFNYFMLGGINKFLGTRFDIRDMELIYTHLGNAVNHDLTVRFVRSGYDLEVLREYERSKA